ncbi:MAG: DUF1318 domain-containing protein [Leptospiraceae bacterium]|nr:DUF1318 domain-containing protein [Leptospiraceae bacterium]
MKVFKLIILLTSFLVFENCVIKLPPITFTQSGTAAERQMIGDEKHLEKDGWIISSIRTSASGSEIWERESLTNDISIDTPDEEFTASLRRLAYFEPEVKAYKKKAYIGEGLDGRLQLNPLMKDSRYAKEFPEYQKRIGELLILVNESRSLILNKRKEFLKKETIDEKKKEAKLQSFLLVYYNRTEDGEYYESARGKWAKKE